MPVAALADEPGPHVVLAVVDERGVVGQRDDEPPLVPDDEPPPLAPPVPPPVPER